MEKEKIPNTPLQGLLLEYESGPRVVTLAEEQRIVIETELGVGTAQFVNNLNNTNNKEKHTTVNNTRIPLVIRDRDGSVIKRRDGTSSLFP